MFLKSIRLEDWRLEIFPQWRSRLSIWGATSARKKLETEEEPSGLDHMWVCSPKSDPVMVINDLTQSAQCWFTSLELTLCWPGRTAPAAYTTHNHTVNIQQDRDPWDEDQGGGPQALKITASGMKISSTVFQTAKGMTTSHIIEE